ncbi:Homeobox protein Hox-D4a [Atta colombica]|uniref:Homeobox protein Hox-D4a n=1 Tax=Atta colombica TaxID=520822 RepID=A0A151I0V5_9HYME|nr:Homeobox protein Hox-D4a [Atta colombica]
MNSFLPSAAGGYHHHQHQQQAGNHHLATTSSLVDPKFPPNEEYSQNNYIPSTGADFFSSGSGGHHLSHPQSQLQYGYHQHHHQAASTPYGASSAVQLNGGYAGYGGYYGPHHPHHQVHAVHHASLHSHHHAVGALAMPPEAQQPPLTCPSSIQSQQQQQQQQQPSVPTSTILGSTPLSPSIMQNHVQQQPDALQHHQHENNACSPAGSGQLHRDNSPDLQTQQSLSQQSQHIQSGQQQTPPQQQQHHVEDSSDADDIEDGQMEGSPGMMEEEEEDEENRDRTIYPWMKKIHVAGVGEFIWIYNYIVCISCTFDTIILKFILFSSFIL